MWQGTSERTVAAAGHYVTSYIRGVRPDLLLPLHPFPSAKASFDLIPEN